MIAAPTIASNAMFCVGSWVGVGGMGSGVGVVAGGVGEGDGEGDGGVGVVRESVGWASELGSVRNGV